MTEARLKFFDCPTLLQNVLCIGNIDHSTCDPIKKKAGMTRIQFSGRICDKTSLFNFYHGQTESISKNGYCIVFEWFILRDFMPPEETLWK